MLDDSGRRSDQQQAWHVLAEPRIDIQRAARDPELLHAGQLHGAVAIEADRNILHADGNAACGTGRKNVPRVEFLLNRERCNLRLRGVHGPAANCAFNARDDHRLRRCLVEEPYGERHRAKTCCDRDLPESPPPPRRDNSQPFSVNRRAYLVLHLCGRPRARPGRAQQAIDVAVVRIHFNRITHLHSWIQASRMSRAAAPNTVSSAWRNASRARASKDWAAVWPMPSSSPISS